MRCLLPVLILALAGCESFREETFTDENQVYEVEGKSYAVRTQFDPLEYAYFTQVKAAEIGPGLTVKDKDAVMGIVENELGVALCDGRKMQLTRFNSENLPGGGNVIFLKSRGLFQVVSRCALDFPEFFPDAPNWPELPKEEDLPPADDVLPDVSSWL